jgi:hypothetical protein
MNDSSTVVRITLPTIEQVKAVKQKVRVDDAVVRSAMAHIPPSWTMIELGVGGAAFRRSNIQVLFSVQRYEDERVWIHVSLCGQTKPNRFQLPSWEEVKRVNVVLHSMHPPPHGIQHGESLTRAAFCRKETLLLRDFDWRVY